MSQNPYATYVAGQDLQRSLEQTPSRIEQVVRGWSPDAFDRSHAPGKWTARQLLVHLAQAEMVFATRLRFGVAEDGYVIQPFDQDAWMEAEPRGDGYEALAVYLALRRMNLALGRSLTPAQRARTFTHPHHGAITVEWVMSFFAGHELNHLPQIEKVAESMNG